MKSLELSNILGGKRSGSEFKAKCPAHEDKRESLSFRDGDDGRLLVYCHAGCTFGAITDALKSRGFNMSESGPVAPGKKFESRKGPSASAAVSNLKMVKSYDYCDETGQFLYQKVRYEPKDFRIRSKSSTGEWEWSNKGKRHVLYHLRQLVSGMRDNATVLLCEGEKDVESIEALGLEGYVATTNIEGAKGWKREYTQALSNARVIVLEDNDDAGVGRTEQLLSALRKVVVSISVVRFAELPEQSDVSDFLSTLKADKRKVGLLDRLATAEMLFERPVLGWSPVPNREHALPHEYIELFYAMQDITVLGRCLLSDEILVRNREGEKEYAASLIPNWRGYARPFGKYFDLDAISDYMERHRREKMEPKLLVDIPQWDRVDRVLEISRVCKFSNVSVEAAYDLICEWGAGIFKRVDDPGYQNVCLILSGAQGVGKDCLIDALTGGLDDYRKELSINNNDLQEAKRQLHTAVLFRIAEFDRTAKVDIAGLKDVLTTASTNERLAYDRRSATRRVRASFVASCNRDNVLVDDTGNRRFWILACEYLGLETVKYDGGMEGGTGRIIDSYPGLRGRPHCAAERKQILAQFRYMAEKGFAAGSFAVGEMGEFMARMQPDSLDDFMIEDYLSAISSLVPTLLLPGEGGGYLQWVDVSSAVQKIAQKYGARLKNVQGLIKRRGLQKVVRIEGRKLRVYLSNSVLSGGDEVCSLLDEDT